MKNGTLNFKKDFQLWKACATDLVRPVSASSNAVGVIMPIVTTE